MTRYLWLLLVLSLSTAALAQEGSLDSSFGGNGIVITGIGENPFTGSAKKIIKNDDGSFFLLLGGNAALASYSASFVLNTSYRNKGLSDPVDLPYPVDAAKQSDGKVVVAGQAYIAYPFGSYPYGEGFMLVRYRTDGSVDQAFGNDGLVKTFFPISATNTRSMATLYAISVQADNKIVAVGQATTFGGTKNIYSFALVRYNPDGSLDQSFGEGGKVLTSFEQGGTALVASANAVSIDGAGKIVAAGTAATGSGVSSGSFALARYNVDGSLDQSFGASGKVLTSFDQGSGITAAASANAVSIDGAGKIVAAGRVADSGGPFQSAFALARYNPGGTLDQSFGTSGKVITPFSNFSGVDYSSATASSMVLHNDGTILAAGRADNDGNGGSFALARYVQNGTLDQSFGTAGKQVTHFPINGQESSSDASISSVAIQDDGKILAAGQAYADWNNGQIGLTYLPSVARYTSDGAPDQSFGDGGRSVLKLTYSSTTSFTAAIEQQDGKLFVGGGATERTYQESASDYWKDNFALARYNRDGSLDQSFGEGGKVITHFPLTTGSYDLGTYIRALALQADGKILAAGEQTFDDYVSIFALARYNPDGSLDESFGEGGKVVTGTVPHGGGTWSLYYVSAVKVQPDGKIIVAGEASGDYDSNYSQSGFALVRYNPDGSLDNSFGNEGKVVTTFPFYGNITAASCQAITLQADGKIIAGGRAGNNNGDDFALARYNPDGSLDQSFGTAGKVVTSFPYRTDNLSEAYVGAIAIQANGKIVAAGKAARGGVNMPNAGDDFALARYNPDGSLDQSFGTQGKVVTPFPYNSNGASDASVSAIAIQANNQIVAAGKAAGKVINGTIFDDFALAWYNSDGSLDQSFGTGGVAQTDVPIEWLNGTLIGTDRIYVVGLAQSLAANYGAVAAFHYNPAPAATITTTALSKASYCQGENINVSYSVSGTFAAGNVFTAQLSDAGGSFASPTVIGSLTSTTEGEISATIPAGTPAGTGYRVRVVSGSPSVVGTDNGANLAVTAPLTWYLDADNDGYYTGSGQVACTSPGSGYKSSGLTAGGDCDDNNKDRWQSSTLYVDSDGDGYTVGGGVVVCYGASVPLGYRAAKSTTDDCNDNDKAIYPGAPELCDGKDNNCNGQVDEGCGSITTWYRDFDGDGFGDPKASKNSPTQPAGYVSNQLDCNDYKLTYEDKDNDGWGSDVKIPCGTITRSDDCNDDDPTVHSLQTFYYDNDGDSYGDPNNKVQFCANEKPWWIPGKVVRNNIDCNDNDPKVYWPKTYYRDADGDGYGDPNNKLNLCSSTPPPGYVTNSKDTDDVNPTVTGPQAPKTASVVPQAEKAAVNKVSLYAFPNPFSGKTTIRYSVPAEANVVIRVFDLNGNEVGQVCSEHRKAGTYSTEYNMGKLAQGTYYCRMAAIENGRVSTLVLKLVKTE